MTLRIGLIGLGAVGALHWSAYQRLDGVRVVAVAEPDRRRRDALVGGAAVDRFDDHRTLLAEAGVDIACVLTPAALHEPVVVDCARAGVHVLCEKPMAPTVEAAERMAAACEGAGVQFCYGASYRHLPAVRRARELVEAGAIGRLQLLREEVFGGAGADAWRALPESHYPPGGPGGSGMSLIDHGIHLIDLFRWLDGTPVRGVAGVAQRQGGTPVTESLRLDAESGATALLAYNSATFPTELPSDGLFVEGEGWDTADKLVPAGGWTTHAGSIHLYGTEASLRLVHYANHLYRFDRAGVRRLPLTGRAPPDHFGTQLEAFAAAIRAGAPPPASAGDGIEALRLALAALGPADPDRPYDSHHRSQA